MSSNDVEIVVYSAVLGEEFLVSSFPMKRPAKDGELVTYTPLEQHEVVRFNPSPRELAALHQVKRMFGGMLMPPVRGDEPLEAAA